MLQDNKTIETDPFYEILKKHEKEKKALSDSFTDSSSVVEYLELYPTKEDCGVLFNPVDVRTFEEWVSPMNPNNYFFTPDIFSMFDGVKISSKKNSRKLSDDVVQMFE